jgi:hypothetical protein
VRVPSASTPSIFCLPSCSFTSLALLDLVRKTNVSPTPASVLSVNCHVVAALHVFPTLRRVTY